MGHRSLKECPPADPDKRLSQPFAGEQVSSVSLPETEQTNKTGIITNRVPAVISPDEVPTARLILRRDRQTHLEQIGQVLDKMRAEKKGYDCVVLCGKDRIMAHRCVLIAHSEYFEKSLFENGNRLMVDVPTDGIPTRGMSALIDYMYSGNLDINMQNAVDALASANALKMPEISGKCSDYVEGLLADENLMGTLQLAEASGADHMYGEAYKRLAKNFYAQTKVTGFLEWDIEKICRLLSNDHIIIETEVHVFSAAMRWIHYKSEMRREHFKRLMDCVRWVYMTTEEIMSCVDQEPGLLKQKEIRELLIDASWYLTLKTYSFTWNNYVIPLPRIRSLRNEDPNVVVQRVRASIESKHSSFDRIFDSRRPSVSKPQPRFERKKILMDPPAKEDARPKLQQTLNTAKAEKPKDKLSTNSKPQNDKKSSSNSNCSTI